MDKIICQYQHVVPAFAQGQQIDAKADYPVKKIFPERAFFYLIRQVSMGCHYQAEIRFYDGIATNCRVFLFQVFRRNRLAARNHRTAPGQCIRQAASEDIGG